MKSYSDSLKTVAAAILLAGTLALSAHAQDANGQISLGTRPGFDLGGQISGYHYGESFRHSFIDEQYGPKFGIIGSGTETFRYGFFGTLEGRFSYGQNYYDGGGATKTGNTDYLGEVRLLGGKDFTTSSFGLSAYAGLGYRNLFNDLRGTADDGEQGYRRDSQYFYLPVGITPRFRVTDTSRISTNIEYDQLIRGWQTTNLGDATPGAGTFVNNQDGGFGVRGSVMYEWSSWSVGPFADYWNINQSNAKVNTTGCPAIVGGCIEPHNSTYELGLQVKYHF